MRACILSIGDELVIGKTVDTNASWLARELSTLGIRPVEFAVVADDRAAIAEAYVRLAGHADILISTGGLGPTADDLTRSGLADAVTPGTDLEQDQVALEHLKHWFRGREMPSANTVQTLRPRGARMLPNSAGTAMGMATTIGRCEVFALPGPPNEMRNVFEGSVRPHLSRFATSEAILSEEVIEYGLGESDAATRLGDLMKRDRNPLVGTTASQSVVAARVIATGERGWAAAEIERTVSEIERFWQPYAFGRSGATLEGAVAELLRERKLKLATAESCTGGLLGSMIVRIPGSSDYYFGGWITYSNELKRQSIGVGEATLEKHGAVSREVAAEMAQGALRTANVDVSLSITGIAGPEGGSDEKPVGTTYIGLAWKSGDGVRTEVRHFRFTGDRQIVRDRAAKAALQMLRFMLVGESNRLMLWEVQAEASAWHRAAVAIGSNVGDRGAHVEYALTSLRQRSDLRDIRVSDIIETAPVGPPGQGPYLNAAMSFETNLSPRELLDQLLLIERVRGRDRTKEVKSGPRSLDLDLLFYSDRVIDEPRLHVPHPRLHERQFVLEPLSQIEPNWVHPTLQKSVRSLLSTLVEVGEAKIADVARASTGRKA